MRFLVVWIVVAILWNRGEATTDKNGKAAELLAQMSLEEKFEMLHGHVGIYVGNVKGNTRLGIPALKMQDGPQGFRAMGRTGGPGSTTAWPAALTVAQTWDESIAYRWATAMSEEWKIKGANIALAPGIGIARVPLAGRNFEYLCGEEPALCVSLGPRVILGFQDNGIMANAKHFVNNEIETDRKHVSSNLAERVEHELYYPPFQAAVDVGVLTVMCSYNRVNDVQACQNGETIGFLKNSMGFEGFLMTDWVAQPATEASMKAGVDMEMPEGDAYSAIKLKYALKQGTISVDNIDDSVYRTLHAMEMIGLLNNNTNDEGNPMADATSPEHNALAREISAKATVLAKNIGDALPLDLNNLIKADKSACIAVFGDEKTVSGTGSGHVTPKYIVTPTEGLRTAIEKAGSKIEVIYGGSDAKQDDVKKLAQQCSVAVVTVATTSGEGSDRTTLSLGEEQDELVTTVADSNSNTIVAVTHPGAVLTPWHDHANVKALLFRGLPGQENGNALADVVLGFTNPSGRLPVTIPNSDNDVGFTAAEFPGVGNPPEAAYDEGMLIGYRWYEYYGVKPVFPFGHGLSYTSFEYSEVKAQQNVTLDNSQCNVEVTVSFKIANVGARNGTEVPQIYLSFPDFSATSHYFMPKKALKAFAAVPIAASSASKSVSMTLSTRDFSQWDDNTHKWELVSGQFGIFVGASSQDIRLQTTINIKAC